MKLSVHLALDFQRPVEPHFHVHTHYYCYGECSFKKYSSSEVKVQLLEKMGKSQCFSFHSGLFRKEAKKEMTLEPADGSVLAELIPGFFLIQMLMPG